MNACVCVHGQEVLNRNLFHSMERNLDDKQSLPVEETTHGRHEMFSVRSRILKNDKKETRDINLPNCNGHFENNIVEETNGVYFLRKLDEEEQRISKLCFTVQLQMWENSPPEEVRGKIRAASGKARLLMTSKFKQFKDLCNLNAGVTISEDDKIPTKADLEGFWDLVMLQIVDVDSNFSHIQKLRNNGWVEEEPVAENGCIKVPSNPSKDVKISSKKKTPQSRGTSPNTKKSSASKDQEAKKRQEARRRLVEAKKAAKKRLAESSPSAEGEVIICLPSPTKSE